MSTEDTGVVTAPEQTATKEPDSSQQGSQDGKGEQVDADLGALLAEYAAEPGSEDTSVKTTSPKAEPGNVEGRLSALEDENKALRQEMADGAATTALAETVSEIQNEHEALKGFDAYQIEGLLEAEAKRDTRITKAWLERQSSPDAWSKIRTALGKKLAKAITPQSDPQMVADQEAARASVRNSSTAAPKGEPADNAKLSEMSDAAFNAHAADEARRLSRGA